MHLFCYKHLSQGSVQRCTSAFICTYAVSDNDVGKLLPTIQNRYKDSFRINVPEFPTFLIRQSVYINKTPDTVPESEARSAVGLLNSKVLSQMWELYKTVSVPDSMMAFHEEDAVHFPYTDDAYGLFGFYRKTQDYCWRRKYFETHVPSSEHWKFAHGQEPLSF